MTPDDARHGTYAGAIAHYMSKTPTCQPCKNAAATYRRQRRTRLYLAHTTTLEVDPIGSIRRIQALVRLGHSMRHIDQLMGWTWGTSSRFIRAGHQATHRTTADRIATIYERLCMTVPTGQYALRNVRLAERHGWLPPLAWDDIDDPDEQPTSGPNKYRHRNDCDPIIVERLLLGDHIPYSTRAEKDECLRLWKLSGRSEKSLCEIHGWKTSRYGKPAA